ncbi:MAG TPA: histidine kinase dimerization/phospho-acceptor domain-containing protein [Candidatus Acidoferrum sp.]|jgi:signal transduction histidine kinase|nr:histidine kinase dimerization/phospho-acceptor domain-containing protein [Candidatus Acidoferrum sp.]
MGTEEQTILLVSDNADLCAAARRELKPKPGRRRVTSVGSIDAARRILVDGAPSVILLEETSVEPEAEGPRGRMPRLDAVVSSLAIHAPVVVIGPPERQGEMTALVAAGAADYVARNESCLQAAIGLVEKRLRQARLMTRSVARFAPSKKEDSSSSDSGDFGEVLRHELNNPLTGILGNAELLLAEVRRKSDGRMPQGGQQRLETITALAVRLRETVRRLSRQWEAQHDPVQRP